MKNNKFVMGTLILIVGSLLTRSLGFIIKVIYTRIIGQTGISLYSLVLPTYSLLLTVATLSLPISISKLVSLENRRSKHILISIYPLVLLINIITIVLVIISSPFIASNLLHQPSTKDYIISMGLVLPFVSLSSLIKGYFFGKQRMSPYAISNVLEQVLRLILIITVLPILKSYSTNLAVIGLILLSIISEIFSIIIFLFFLPKNVKINKNDFKLDPTIVKDTLKVSIPTTGARLIGNIGYFFEPIILTNILLFTGYSKNFILMEYGTYNAYAITLLLMPSFFLAAITTSLVPEVSKIFIRKDKKMLLKRIKQSLYSSFFLGLICNIFLFIFAHSILKVIFNTTEGINYIRVLAPFFLLFYIEAPLSSILQAMDKPKETARITLNGVIIKTIVLTVTSFFHIGIYSLVIAEITSILFVVYYNYIELKKSYINMT